MFSVTVSGSDPFSYQWRNGGIPINATTNPSANTATLSLTNVQPGDAGSYDCIVTNPCGSVTSDAATLDVYCDCPTFDMQGGVEDAFDLPAENLGASQSLRNALEIENPRQLLKFDEIPNVTPYLDPAADRNVAHTFSVIPPGVVAATLEFRVRAGGSNFQGAEGTDHVRLGFATGSGAGAVFTQRWKRFFGTGNSTDAFFPGLAWRRYHPTTNPQGDQTLTLDLAALPVASQDGGGTLNLIPEVNIRGFLDFIVGDDSGVDHARLSGRSTDGRVAAWIGQQPESVAGCVGSTATFSVRANVAGGPHTYQWRKDGVPLTSDGRLSGTATPTLVINSIAGGDAGGYDCMIVGVNTCGSITSGTAALTLSGTPAWSPAPTGPSARNNACYAFDASRQRVVLFGGRGVSEVYLGDTWEFDGSAWTMAGAAGPSARSMSKMAFDPDRNQCVLYGGSTGSGPTFTVLGDTWTWNGVQWQQAAPSGSTPGVLSAHAMAFDPVSRRVILFGGSNNGGGNGGFSGQTWAWDGTTWTLVSTSGPSARDNHDMVVDERTGRILLFGGGIYEAATNRRTQFGDTWSWTGTAWVQVGSGGPARDSTRLSYNTIAGRAMMFGGILPSNLYVNDVFEWSGSMWSPVSVLGAQPPGRQGHVFTKNPRGGPLVLGGRLNSQEFVADSWTLGVCSADTDDGSGTGTCDGGVTIDDLLYYLLIFEAGDIRADVDDGSATGIPDGGVTIDDLLYYLFRFEAGC